MNQNEQEKEMLNKTHTHIFFPFSQALQNKKKNYREKEECKKITKNG